MPRIKLEKTRKLLNKFVASVVQVVNQPATALERETLCVKAHLNTSAHKSALEPLNTPASSYVKKQTSEKEKRFSWLFVLSPCPVDV